MIILAQGPIWAGKSTFALALEEIDPDVVDGREFMKIDLVMVFLMKDKMSVRDSIEQLNGIVSGSPNFFTHSTVSGDSPPSEEEEKMEVGNEEAMEEEKQDTSVTKSKIVKEFYFPEIEDCLVIQNIIDDVISYVKEEWQMNWVVYPILNINMWESLFKLNYCLLVEIDAPIVQRLHRFNNKYKRTLTLNEFVELDDTLKFKTNFCDSRTLSSPMTPLKLYK